MAAQATRHTLFTNFTRFHAGTLAPSRHVITPPHVIFIPGRGHIRVPERPTPRRPPLQNPSHPRCTSRLPRLHFYPDFVYSKITTDIHNDVEAQNLLLDESVNILLVPTIYNALFAEM